jgi:multicomponent K+:H+ antiporter subunit E
MKKRRFYPAMPVFLLGVWLLLNQSLSTAYLASGLVLSLALTFVFGRLQLPRARIRNLHRAPVLMGRVLTDVVRSNLAVAFIILTGRGPSVTSDFVKIKLDLKDRYGLAVLASIITAAPGTVWVDYQPEAGVLQIHVLDLIDEAAWVDRIKTRYERPLMEIFE